MNDDINTKRTELANQMAAAGAALLDFTGTACAMAAIPDTEPQQYVAAGTPENIAAILPATISPQRRQKHGERPSADSLEFDEPAATSGDAPADDQWMFDLAAEYESRGAGLYGPITFTAQQLPNFVQAVIARIERAAAPANTGGTMLGVGDGSGKLFVRGDYDSIKAVQAIIFENERLRAASTIGAAQTADQVRAAVARAIWNIRREEEDRCDMELEDMGDEHAVWQEADAAIQAMARPTTTHNSEAGE